MAVNQLSLKFTDHWLAKKKLELVYLTEILRVWLISNLSCSLKFPYT